MSLQFFARRRTFGMILAIMAGACMVSPTFAAEEVIIASDGQGQLDIVLSADMEDDESVIVPELDGQYGRVEFVEQSRLEHRREMADTLAEYLQRMTGGSFETRRGDGTSGIALGVYTDFPALDFQGMFNPEDVLRREEYVIRTHPEGVYLIGATELALQHAVWDFLHRLGHRQFFPTDSWEIVPDQPDLVASIDAFESPDYHTRTIRGGFSDERLPRYHTWSIRNRAVPGFPLRTTHEYNRIRSRNREAFAGNPEFFAMVDGVREERSHAKFNVANPDLRQLVVEDAIRWFEEHPHQMSKSMDPSDYGGWSESEVSRAIGGPSDQAVYLANEVAEAVNEHFDRDRYVGMYAYYQHDVPPENVRVHPHVIVSFATDFLSPGDILEDIMQGWSDMGLELAGIREYHAVYGWMFDVPYLSTHGASLHYLTRTIPQWHEQHGARFYHSEAFDNWGPNGLTQYVSARLLWDSSEAERVDEIVDDFLDKAFGPARAPMAAYYRLINGEDRPLFADDGVGRMYELLDEAWTLAEGHEAVRERLKDLILYARYLEIFRDFELALPDERQEAFERLIRHIYRTRDSMMVQIRDPYIRDRIGGSTDDVAMPEAAAWDVPEEENPWKSSEPFTDSEVLSILSDGLAAYAQRSAGAPVFRALNPDFRADEPQRTPTIREVQHYVLSAKEGEQVTISVRCRTMRSAQIPFFVVRAPSGEIVVRAQAPVREERDFSFEAPETGTYRIAFEGTANVIQVSATNPFGILAKVPVGLHSTDSSQHYPVTRHLPEALGNYGTIHFKRATGRLYFHVPAGVEEVKLLVAGRGDGELINATLRAPDGEAVDAQENISEVDPHLFSASRDNPQEEQVWSIELERPSTGHHGDFYVTMGADLPPVLSMSPEMVFVAE